MNPVVPEDIKNLLADLETFVSEFLKGESLSKKSKEKRDALLKKIKEVKQNYPQDFQDKGEFDDLDESETFSHSHDTLSLASDRDKDDELPSEGNLYPPIAAQELTVSKGGYLEKRRKDHSFFASEWQKRWCAISNSIFYYYGSDKDKQQKGEFSLEGYSARINNTVRKDAKKDCCFEIFAPDKRVYQFAASTTKEAEDWVNAVLFLRDGEGDELYDDVNQESSLPTSGSSHIPVPVEDDDIYEELPEESSNPMVEKETPKPAPTPSSNASGKDTDYANFYRGLWDCIADHPDELSFKYGDVIYILSKEYNTYGWWVGEMKGTIGLVPKAYIMEMYDI
ncbi:src kinase-associated phospho 2 isoform X1 [Pelobates cultripes]|uniref:Src kinase-associated phospho 2 isoform X1 n=1 Tax=Pelobates cultripes TaxID=61616 RepID=A0AAD1RWK5_PELCU|nr:src kinase-associated phospho 2 isoform X1 [Pelobates cultripes]